MAAGGGSAKQQPRGECIIQRAAAAHTIPALAGCSSGGLALGQSADLGSRLDSSMGLGSGAAAPALVVAVTAQAPATIWRARQLRLHADVAAPIDRLT